MRVTAETQAATRERILESARKLFAAGGFEAATTRDIARGADIAVGTVFNYFPTKEVIVEALAARALTGVEQEAARHDAGAGSLEEALFAFVAAGLRKLRPLRNYLPAILESSLSPLAAGGKDAEGLRLSHLEAVVRLASRHGFPDLSPVALQIYWSLYLGLLLFWANDSSPRQEDTLALLDHSLEMFTGWLNQTRTDALTLPQRQ